MNTAQNWAALEQGFADTDQYHEAFSAGATVTPATPATSKAAQRIKEGWPRVRRQIDAQTALKGATDAEKLEAIGNVVTVLGAATVVREALEAGARIELPEKKTPNHPPRG